MRHAFLEMVINVQNFHALIKVKRKDIILKNPLPLKKFHCLKRENFLAFVESKAIEIFFFVLFYQESSFWWFKIFFYTIVKPG